MNIASKCSVGGEESNAFSATVTSSSSSSSNMYPMLQNMYLSFQNSLFGNEQDSRIMIKEAEASTGQASNGKECMNNREVNFVYESDDDDSDDDDDDNFIRHAIRQTPKYEQQTNTDRIEPIYINNDDNNNSNIQKSKKNTTKNQKNSKNSIFQKRNIKNEYDNTSTSICNTTSSCSSTRSDDLQKLKMSFSFDDDDDDCDSV